MNLAILSGKGGTGKTTIAVNLAEILQANYIDCDVEEPNGFIFLKPSINHRKQVEVNCPSVDQEKCTLCGECVRVCQFNALFNSKKQILVFEKMCHSCGACSIVCQPEALTYLPRAIGVIEEGEKNSLICRRGILDIGEPMAVPVIRELLSSLPEGINLLDCSPGTSCNAVTTLHHAQGAVLVTEPSAFGLHDLKMAIALVRMFELPFGVIINKWNDQGVFVEEYLRKEGITILGRVAYQREAAEVYSRGGMLTELSSYQEVFKETAQRCREVFGWK